MKKITINHQASQVLVTDWAGKEWTLLKNGDHSVSCPEMPGAKFHSAPNFVHAIYGVAFILAEGGGAIAYRNYEVETILSNN